MSKNVSLLLLGALLAGAGFVFFQVVRPFIFALLFAGVLTVLFQPVFRRLATMLGNRRRIAAGIVTGGVLVLILAPLGGAVVLAGGQLVGFGQDVMAWIESPEESELSIAGVKLDDILIIHNLAADYGELDPSRKAEIKQLVSGAARDATQGVYKRTLSLAGDVVNFVIGTVVMGVALYYFFADGPELLNHAKQLSPLRAGEENELIAQFEKVCRGLIMGTVVSAVVQAILAGVGFAIAGVERYWLGAALTMLCAFVPFLGAAAVWIVVSAALVVHQQYLAAAFVACYGALIVSTSDNLIKAYIIGGEAKLHPLIVLVTVLGAIQFVGLWGVILGPMAAAFFFALADIFRKRAGGETTPELVTDVASSDDVDAAIMSPDRSPDSSPGSSPDSAPPQV